MNEALQQKITHYKIRYEHGTLGSDIIIESSVGGTYELTKLDPLTEYKVTVQGMFEGQPTVRSNEIVVRTDAAGISSPCHFKTTIQYPTKCIYLSLCIEKL